MSPFGYVYKITNKVTGRMYIGQHKGSKVDYYYTGSCFELLQDIKKLVTPSRI